MSFPADEDCGDYRLQVRNCSPQNQDFLQFSYQYLQQRRESWSSSLLQRFQYILPRLVRIFSYKADVPTLLAFRYLRCGYPHEPEQEGFLHTEWHHFFHFYVDVR